MKILHVWDQAGVSCLLAKYQKLLGHKADIMKLEEYSAGFLKYYGLAGKLFYITEKINRDSFVRSNYYKLPVRWQGFIRSAKRKLRSFRFYLKVRKAAKDYDIVHIHSQWKVAFLIPFKPKIMHWHGDDCRNKPSLHAWWNRLRVKFFIRLYDLLGGIQFVSTPDLLDEVHNSKWLPNPVDNELFRRSRESKPNTAIYFRNWYETGEHASKLAEDNLLKLTVVNRNNASEWIPYEKMPAFLSQFEYFIDRKNIHSLSKTALESLTLGLKVIQWDEMIITGIDSIHDPLRCAKEALAIYKEKLN